jgi:hypothetical protein
MTDGHVNESPLTFSAEARALLEQLGDHRLRDTALAAQVAANARGASEVSASDVKWAMSRANAVTAPATATVFDLMDRALYGGSAYRRLIVGVLEIVVIVALLILLISVAPYAPTALVGGIAAVVGAANAMLVFGNVREGRRMVKMSEATGSYASDEVLAAEAQFLASWRNLEQVLYKTVSRAEGTELRGQSLGLVLNKYAALEALSPDDVLELRRLVQLRNNLVHGGASSKPRLVELRMARDKAEHFARLPNRDSMQ